MEDTISIHAPQWGATVLYSDTDGMILISIHAPQWGATSMNLLWRHTEAYFNPRTPVGCDGGLTVESTNSHEFQSTHPSGVRPREWA